LEEKGIETLALDVTSAESIAALKKEIISRTGGKLDMLFNNAGTRKTSPILALLEPSQPIQTLGYRCLLVSRK
jgi:NAD(P)-dependent dehydrogenase (short-subunit alcohol dehydrogenase family)